MTLKKHVVHHLKFLLSAGLKVILIINSDEPKLPFLGYMSLKDDLCGIYVRENIGLDFPAWGQVFSLQSETDKWARLYLVNDSIAGPIDSASFDYMMQRIRSLDADMIGLVANDMPRYHLQSFFLVFGENVLRCAELGNTLTIFAFFQTSS